MTLASSKTALESETPSLRGLRGEPERGLEPLTRFTRALLYQLSYSGAAVPSVGSQSLRPRLRRPRRARCRRGRSRTRARPRAARSRCGVEPALEHAEHHAEERVAPGGLREGAAVAASGGSRRARGGSGPRSGASGQVATCSASAGAGPRTAARAGQNGRTLRVGGAERRPVLQVHGQARPRAIAAAGHGLAEQLDVVVVASRKPACRAAAGPPRPPRRAAPARAPRSWCARSSHTAA